jgi:hypothetical protein
MKGDEFDPKALIREAYRIDGITAPECRSIFLDWALSLPAAISAKDGIMEMISRYGADQDHPMTGVLTDGLAAAAAPKRRGGMRARRAT